MVRLQLSALAALLLAAASAHATAVKPHGRAELALRSDTVVRARVLDRAAARSARSGRPLVVTGAQVLEALKGKASGRIEIEQLAGGVDAQVLGVAGDARLEPGEEAVLFLRCEGKPRCRLFGLALGKYSVRPDPSGRKRAVRDARGLTDLEGRALAEDSLPLDQLIREVRGAR